MSKNSGIFLTAASSACPNTVDEPRITATKSWCKETILRNYTLRGANRDANCRFLRFVISYSAICVCVCPVAASLAKFDSLRLICSEFAKECNFILSYDLPKELFVLGKSKPQKIRKLKSKYNIIPGSLGLFGLHMI